MSRSSRRLLSLFLIVLQILLAVSKTQAQEVVNIGHDEPAPTDSIAAIQSPLIQQDIDDRDQTTLPDETPGAHLVHQAVSKLNRLRPSASSSISRRPAGLLSTVFQYAKELVLHMYISGPPEDPSAEQQIPARALKGPLREAVSLLEHAATLYNPDAIYLLAQLNFYGNFSYPRNYTESFRRYSELATMDGNSSAQHMVGFMYATGFGEAVKRDQAKALLYHTFAAQAGHTRSEMTVAFRHHAGIGTARNCDEASLYYKKVADKVIRWFRSGPPGGMGWQSNSYRLADEVGGVYGEGASVSSAGINAQKGGPNSDANAALEDVLEYLDVMSGKGDFKATFGLGKIYYEGQKDLPRNMRTARKYFQMVASQYWKKDGSTVSTADKPGLEATASKAAGYLGRMFLRGEGADQNYKKAMKWFLRGLKGGDAGSQTALGIIYLHGHGVKADAQRAFDYFKAAAEQDYPPAQIRLGALYLDQGSPSDVQVATRYFELAARYGHIEALYFLGDIVNQGIGRDRSCGLATAYYKTVVEKAEPFVSSFMEANQAHKDGNDELSLIEYLMAAEQGFEKAQANVAYLLDHGKSMLPLTSLSPVSRPKSSILRNAALALIFWTRSAKQSNIDSLVKMGDYYLEGLGAEKDLDKAVSCYTAASEFHQSAQALYNLGWMHENGVGLTQDYHLAKRYYDLALETNEEAYLPVTLSLFKLRAKSAWNTLTRGKINSIHDEPVPHKKWSIREWISNFLEDGQQYFVDDEYDDEMPSQGDHMPGGDVDGYYDDVIDDGIIESLIIVTLAAALVWLVYYRQTRQLAHRRAEEERARQAGQPIPPAHADGGLFPPAGDLARPGWLAGGIGH